MMGLIGRIFGHNDTSSGDGAYAKAMTVSEDLIARMREASRSTDPARAVMADIWSQKNNIPFMATVYEAVQEMKAATDQE